MPRVLLLDSVSTLLPRLLQEAGIEVLDLSQAANTEIQAALAEAEGVVVRSRTRIDAATIDRAPNLKVIGRAGAGTDTIDVGHARARGVHVQAVGGGNDVAVAELVLAQMLAMARHLVPAALAARQGEWIKSKCEGIELAGESIGIVGLGKIGGRVAHLSLAFGMEVYALDPYVDTAGWEMKGVRIVPLAEMLPLVRFLTVHVPLNDETRTLIGREELARMRRDAYVINCARGGVIDEDALASALEEGRLAGAALDVFRTEPKIPARLGENPRVIATPHIGGSTQQAQEKIAAQLAHALIQFFRGAA